MIKIGKRFFYPERHTYVMGILNVTPDSFSDGGHYYDADAALKHAEEMVRDGADIIDVGGESARPGFTRIDDIEEISRVIPVIEKIKSHLDVPVSLDTYKGDVAWAGIRAGADMINDIYGLKYDRKMAGVVSDAHVPICLMHNREVMEYDSFMEDVISDLQESIDIALANGIQKNNIVLDPGVGFAKTYEQNLQIMANLDRLKDLGYPVLLGVSRKSVIGRALHAVDVHDRLEGTMACGAWGMLHGAGFLRVHDVKEHVDLVHMMEIIRDARGGEAVEETKPAGSMLHTAYLSIGSNMGDRMAYIRKALNLMARDPDIAVIDMSEIIETVPYGNVEQGNFLNAVIRIETTYEPEVLLDHIRTIEIRCDRIRGVHWGPRTLDLDILLYDDMIIDEEDLTIPHRDMHNRRFVLDPMCEIAPHVIHPVFGCTIEELRNRLQSKQ